MWITRDVDLPEEVLTALKEGKLVVFAGAGVSKDPPAGFPDFNELAKQVERQCAGVLRWEEGESIDRYFGRLEQRGVAIHEIVRGKLTDPDSKPNDSHHALIGLFPQQRDVRIVTTNFDRHFTTAAVSRWGSNIEQYFQPALPLGRDFRGIVYLHGSVEQSPDKLILTDRDFGRAYLTDGWATRFLHAMFSHYTVLFVGYSNGDPVVQYLARGLPPETPRFALVPSDQVKEWRLFDIRTIPYSLADAEPKHHALPEAIRVWGEWQRLGFADHEQRIKELVATKPPLEPDKLDYILACLRETPTARIFIRYANDPDWLGWVADKGLLKSLFNPLGVTTEAERWLAIWFAQSFACRHADAALEVLREQGGRLHSTLWYELAQFLSFTDDKPDPAVLAVWVAILLQTAPQQAPQTSFLEYILKNCRYPEDISTALTLYAYLSKPQVELKPNFAIPESEHTTRKKVRTEVNTWGDRHWLEEAWKSIFKPNFGVLVDHLLPLVEHQLRNAHRLLLATGTAGDWYDPISFGRKAIEPHDQDRYPDDFDTIIDAARDLIDHLLQADPVRAKLVISTWASSSVPLLKRLAIYGVTRSLGMSQDDKLTWLLEKQWLYQHGLKHEVFQLLKNAYPSATEPLRAQLLDAVCKGPVGPEHEKLEEDTRHYEAFNLLYWLSEVAPQCRETADRFAAMRKAHPQFGTRKWADFDSWSESMTGGRESPISMNELLEKPISEILDLLVTFKGDSFIGPDRMGLTSVVQSAASASVEWAWRALEALKDKKLWVADLWTSIIQGLLNAPLDEECWERLLDFLQATPEVYVFGYPVSEVLLGGIRKEQAGIPDSLLTKAENLAEAFFKVLCAEQDYNDDEKDWLHEAINDPGGKTVWFWIFALSRRRREAGDWWQGLPEDYRRYFALTIDGTSKAQQMGRVMLTSQLHFLSAVDAVWTRENVIPLMDWAADRRRAQQAWHGYLGWAHWSKKLLPDLIPLFVKSYAELSRGLAKQRERFCEHLASITVHGTDNPVDEGLLTPFLSVVEDQDRKSWTMYVGRELGNLPAEAKGNLWTVWLQRYWTQRQQGIPMPLAEQETQHMVEWAVKLEPVFPSVVELICAQPMPDLKQTRFYYDLVESKLASTQPETTATLLLHLLQTSREPFYHGHDAQKLYAELKSAGAPAPLLLGIQNSLLRLGVFV